MKRLSAIVLLLLVIFSACQKNKHEIGKGAIDQDQLLNGITTDTFDLITYTINEDSAITDNMANVLLGSYIDPKFGEVTASFYTEFRLKSINPNFGDIGTIVYDSCVLALQYVGYYGDLNPQTFEVYELSDSLSMDSIYYDFSTKPIKPGNLIAAGTGTMTPKPLSNAVVDGDTLAPQLRLHLDTVFAKHIIQESANGNGTFSSNVNFQNFFKGFRINVNNPSQTIGQGAILYFNINNNAASKLTIYYTQSGVKKSYDIVMNSQASDFVHLETDHAGTPLEMVLQDSTKGQTTFYAQAFRQRAVVKIPGLDNLPKNLVVHRAELTLPVQFQNGYRYKPGSAVSVATRLKASDTQLANLNVIGAYVDSKKHYAIDLRTYAQALIADHIDNTGVVVSPVYFRNSAERIVFNGPNTINKYKPKLVLTYTTY
ncbi:MAG: DUF4270 family protein [Flavobacteriales bacterium]